MENIFITLPVDILSLIYMYDNTYHIKFKEVIIQINAQRRFDEVIYHPYLNDYWDNSSYSDYEPDYDDLSVSDNNNPVYYNNNPDNNPVYYDTYRTYISLEEKQEQFRLEVEMLKFEKEKFEELLCENNNTIDHRYRNYKNSNKKFTKIQKYEVGIKANNKKNKSKTTR